MGGVEPGSFCASYVHGVVYGGYWERKDNGGGLIFPIGDI